MKNLANCTPREFLRQTGRIKKHVQDWLTLTGIMEIRKRLPKLPVDVSVEDRRKAMAEQSKANLSAMFDAICEEHPDESAELLGMLCFIEPEDIDKYKMSDLLGAFSELLNCEEVIDFFTSLIRLVTNDTSTT